MSQDEDDGSMPPVLPMASEEEGRNGVVTEQQPTTPVPPFLQFTQGYPGHSVMPFPHAIGSQQNGAGVPIPMQPYPPYHHHHQPMPMYYQPPHDATWNPYQTMGYQAQQQHEILAAQRQVPARDLHHPHDPTYYEECTVPHMHRGLWYPGNRMYAGSPYQIPSSPDIGDSYGGISYVADDEEQQHELVNGVKEENGADELDDDDVQIYSTESFRRKVPQLFKDDRRLVFDNREFKMLGLGFEELLWSALAYNNYLARVRPGKYRFPVLDLFTTPECSKHKLYLSRLRIQEWIQSEMVSRKRRGVDCLFPGDLLVTYQNQWVTLPDEGDGGSGRDLIPIHSVERKLTPCDQLQNGRVNIPIEKEDEVEDVEPIAANDDQEEISKAQASVKELVENARLEEEVESDEMYQKYDKPVRDKQMERTLKEFLTSGDVYMNTYATLSNIIGDENRRTSDRGFIPTVMLRVLEVKNFSAIVEYVRIDTIEEYRRAVNDRISLLRAFYQHSKKHYTCFWGFPHCIGITLQSIRCKYVIEKFGDIPAQLRQTMDVEAHSESDRRSATLAKIRAFRSLFFANLTEDQCSNIYHCTCTKLWEMSHGKIDKFANYITLFGDRCNEMWVTLIEQGLNEDANSIKKARESLLHLFKISFDENFRHRESSSPTPEEQFKRTHLESLRSSTGSIPATERKRGSRGGRQRKRGPRKAKEDGGGDSDSGSSPIASPFSTRNSDEEATAGEAAVSRRTESADTLV